MQTRKPIKLSGGAGRDDLGAPQHDRFAGASNQRLRQELAAHEATRRELQNVRAELNRRSSEYDIALRGSNVTIFKQALDLRYTSISKSLFGLQPGDLLGHSDNDVLSAPSAALLTRAKREALAKGRPIDAELRVERGADVFWYELHIEPLSDIFGNVVGLTGAAVDITERKQNEAHLRLLMRELTHRSKNLLAVIQGMARQTARHAGTIENFLERFGARLQALARSHDLLIQESWHGVSLDDLVRSQLGHYLDREKPQILVQGPHVQLKPEAAQSLGLALHELATNAAKHGALTRAKGRVDVQWRWREPEEGGIEIVWSERGGPKVGAADHRGFGTLVIQHSLSSALGAEVDLAFLPEGLRCRVVVPRTHISVAAADTEPPRTIER